MKLYSPPYSFITLEGTYSTSNCQSSSLSCYPVVKFGDISFQVFATSESFDLLSKIGVYLQGVRIGRFTWYRVLDTEYVGQVYWLPEADQVLLSLKDSSCFSLQVKYGDNLEKSVSIGECFQRVVTPCCTSILTYWSRCAKYGFVYQDSVNALLFQRLRLKSSLSYPEYAAKRVVYRSSLGSFNKLSSVLTKIWEFETDYLSEFQLQALAIAFEHENILITTEENITHRVSLDESESVKPQWIKDIGCSFKLGKVTLKVRENIPHSISTYCGPCGKSLVSYSYSYLDGGPVGGDLRITQACGVICYVNLPQPEDKLLLSTPYVNEQYSGGTLELVWSINPSGIHEMAIPNTTSEIGEVIKQKLLQFYPEGSGVFTFSVSENCITICCVEGGPYDGEIGNWCSITEDPIGNTYYGGYFQGGSDG